MAATEPISARTARLIEFASQQSHITTGKVETMEDLKDWMDDTCRTFIQGPEDAEKGFFRTKCDDLLDELRSVSVRGFEQHEIYYAAKNDDDWLATRTSFKAAIVNDDANQLRALIETLNVKNTDDRPLRNYQVRKWLVWAARDGAKKCAYMLTTTPNILKVLKEYGGDTNEDVSRDHEKEWDPVYAAVEAGNLDILSHLLCWETLRFQVHEHTAKTAMTEEIQTFLREWNENVHVPGPQMISPFNIWKNREAWNNTQTFWKTFKKTLKEAGTDNAEDIAIMEFEDSKERIRETLKVLEQIIRDIFLIFEDKGERERFLETMENNPAIKVWDDSFSTYNSVIFLAASQFGINAWNQAVSQLSVERDRILVGVARKKRDLSKRVAGVLPLNAPQPIVDPISSYRHIYKTQEALRFVLLDIAASTSAELYCGDPKGLARAVEKVSLSVISDIIHRRRPKEYEEREPGRGEKRCLKVNKKLKTNLDNYECDELWDLWDYVRGMLIYRTIPAITNALLALKKHRSVEIVNIDNHFKNARVKSKNGWQDVMVHVKLRNLPDEYVLEKSLVCEIQLALEPLVVARRSLGGHEAYSLYRLANEFKSFIEQIDGIDRKKESIEIDGTNAEEDQKEEEKEEEKAEEKEVVLVHESVIFNEVRTSPMILDRVSDPHWEVDDDRVGYIASLYDNQWNWKEGREVVETHEAYLGKRFNDEDWKYFWKLFGIDRDEGQHMSLGLFVASRAFRERASLNIRYSWQLKHIEKLPPFITALRQNFSPPT